MKIVLNDNSEIEVQSITFEPHFVINCENRDRFIEVWDKLTDDNLANIKVYNGETLTAGFSFCRLFGTQTVHNYDGSLTAHFYLEGQAVESVDPEYKEAYNALVGE